MSYNIPRRKGQINFNNQINIMAPLSERCGNIVCQFKQETHKFSFSCLFCEHRTTVFEDFKFHLLHRHTLQMPSAERKNKKLRSQSKEVPKSSGIIMSQQETKDSTPCKQQKDPLVGNAEQLSDFETDSEPEPDSQLLSNNDSDSSTEETETEGTESDRTESEGTESAETNDVSYFWLRQHPIMHALIEQVEEERWLWDSGMLEYRNYKRRSEACLRIARQLNGKFALQFNCQDIVKLVKNLRAAYTAERQRLEKNADAAATAAWYYEPLRFLYKSSMRERRSNLEQAIDSNLDTSLPVPQLTKEQNLKLIEIYQRCNRLWDMQDLTCRLRHVRAAARELLLQNCRSEIQLDLEPSQLQRYVKQMRKAYVAEKVRRLKCQRKRVEYSPRIRFQAQLQFLDDHIAPFQCAQCSQMLNSVDRYKIHCAEHDGVLPFICPICKRGFARSDNCTIHLRRHTQDFHLSCDICGKGYPNTTDLQVHKRTHTGEKPYCCDICGSRFTTSSLFDRHRRRHEQQPQGKCHICGKAFYETSVLNDHIKGHLNVRDKKCDICLKTFTSAKYLRQHREIHASHKRYICKMCGKCFSQYAGLSGHMKCHVKKVRDKKGHKENQTEQDGET